jgi:cytochrome oxidase Cu insertion factor (SCO1/SenC/PrrC family)
VRRITPLVRNRALFSMVKMTSSDGRKMTNGNQDTSRDPNELDEEQRAAIFAAANAPRDRHGAIRTRRVTVPRKFIAWTIVAVLVLGFGGEIAQHFFETYGKASPAATTTPVLKGTPTTNPSLPSLISLQVFIGLKDIGDEIAPTFTLRTQRGRTWRLASHKGQVIVLAFYNSNCSDICPVLGKEIALASHELGAQGATVHFVIVNTDPHATKISTSSEALSVPGLSGDHSVTLLSGRVDVLNHVWSAYGIRVIVGAKASEVSHNNALYFIGPNGNLVSYSAPFGTESKTGLYSLDLPSLRTYARAIAETADSLVQ